MTSIVYNGTSRKKSFGLFSGPRVSYIFNLLDCFCDYHHIHTIEKNYGSVFYFQFYVDYVVYYKF